MRMRLGTARKGEAVALGVLEAEAELDMEAKKDSVAVAVTEEEGVLEGVWDVVGRDVGLLEGEGRFTAMLVKGAPVTV